MTHWTEASLATPITDTRNFLDLLTSSEWQPDPRSIVEVILERAWMLGLDPSPALVREVRALCIETGMHPHTVLDAVSAAVNAGVAPGSLAALRRSAPGLIRSAKEAARLKATIAVIERRCWKLTKPKRSRFMA